MKRLLALTVLVAALFPVGSADAVDPPSAVSGQVIDESGEAVAGADVALYLASQTTDQSAPVASTRSDEGGNYALGVENTAILQDIADKNGGYVNFDLVVTTPTLVYMTALSRQYANGLWESSPSKNVAMNPASKAVVRERNASFDATNMRTKVKCGKLPVRADTRFTDIGEYHSPNDSWGHFTYGRSADSDIGVGFAQTGQGWHVSGSVHVGNTNSSNVGWQKGSNVGRRLQSQFKYMLYRWVSCVNPDKTVSHEINAQAWTSGARNGQKNGALDNHCDNSRFKAVFGKGTHFDRTSNTAVTFNGAVSIFGASLTAQSGYSTWVQSHWNFGDRTKAHVLCGSDNYIGYSHRIYAGR